MAEHAPIAVQLFYEDVRVTVAWLCHAFGFTEAWTLDGEDGVLLMATLQTPGGSSVMVSTLVPDVDTHAAAARSAGATLISEPTSQPWGYRDYEVLDLVGRQWNFSQVEHEVTPEDWGATAGPSTS